MRTVTVQLGERSYPIFIGDGARHRLASVVRELSDAARIVVIADRHVAKLHSQRALEGLESTPTVLTFPRGERFKSLRQAERLYHGLGRAQIARRDLIVTLGGGVAGDLGGFVAATWMRGVRFVQMPTTLAAAIDASVGGKTGVNHRAGKNLIGAFHQPEAVLIDPEFIDTLPQRDYVAGLAESIKHAVVRDAAFLEWQERHAGAIVAREPDVLEELIARNCQIKADIVARDERESDLRMILNHGHTIGHAIEHLLRYKLRHGECVGLGMIVENELACMRGLLDRHLADRLAQLLERLGLPVRLPGKLEPEELAEACRMDKKVRRDAVNFVLVKALGVPERLADISADEIAAALQAVQPV